MALFRASVLVLILGVFGWHSSIAETKPSKVPAAAPAQTITFAQAEQILAELRAIKAMLEDDRKADAANGMVRLPDTAVNVLGSPTAPVTIVEFTDYQCPYCRRFHDQSWAELKKNYIETGKVRFVVRDLPLDFHDQALPSALAARCAGEQDKYWPMYEALLGLKDSLTKDAVRRTAVAVGINMDTFDTCLKNPGLRRAIENDIAEAQRIGVSGTPGFVIAQRRDGQLEGVLLLGAQPTAVFASRIDALLAGH